MKKMASELPSGAESAAACVAGEIVLDLPSDIHEGELVLPSHMQLHLCPCGANLPTANVASQFADLALGSSLGRMMLKAPVGEDGQ